MNLSDDEQREDLGVVSFALLGVLIILLSIFAAAYISRVDRINYENELRNDKISELENSIDNSIDTIENKIKYIGVQSAFKAGVNDGANVSQIFTTRLDEYMDERRSSGEWKHAGTTVKITDHNLTIGPQTASVKEFTPEEDGDVINNDGPGTLNNRNTTFCYEVTGTLNLTASNGGLDLNKRKDIDTTIDVPFPFMKNKMDTFGTNLRGDKSHISRITEYTLTTLAQYRTLNGYGMESLEGNEGSHKATEKIITEKDVEIAVNLALLFEIAYHYRSYDPEHVDSILNNVTHLKRDRLNNLLTTYLSKERIDPGDIITLYHSYSYDDKVIEENESVEMDLKMIVAQTMNALVDQFVLKHLENFKVTPGLDLLFKGVQKAEEIYESVTDFIYGDDEDEINPQQVQVVKEWVRSIFISSGLMDTNLMKNYYGRFDTFDGEKIVGYPNLPEDYKFEDKFFYLSRLEGKEHEWYNYSCGHGELYRKRGHTCDEIIKEGEDEEGNPVKVRCGAEEIKEAHDFRRGQVYIEVKDGPVSFRPVDILEGNDEIWQKFYNEHFKSSVDEDPSGIRSAVKEIIHEFIDELIENDKIEEIIQKYNNIEVDPADEVSFLEDIQVNVDAAIRDVVDHFRKNPDEIANILKSKLHEEGDPKVEDLIYFLNENYDSLVSDDRVHCRGANRTAHMLTDPDSPYYEITKKETSFYIDDVNGKCDFSWMENRSIKRHETSEIIQNGGVFGTVLVNRLAGDIKEQIENLYEEVKKREIHISESDKNVSEKDGLIIQALNDYQYNTSYENQKDTYSTRSGSSYAWIDEITPDPATQGQHTVFFQGNTSSDYREVEWKSNIDGHLSNEIRFNRSARFMSSGEHEITLQVMDKDGMIHEDQKTLFINVPPIAGIEEISPDPATESQDVTFIDSSRDPDGYITETSWDFGDGNSSQGEEVTYNYSEPGIYTVNLTIWDDKGGFDTETRDVLVDDAPRVTDINPDTSDIWDTYTEIEVKFSEPVEPSSFQYSINPHVEFEELWSEKNRTLVLDPVQPYPRETRMHLTIEDVHDVDNGTSSSLFEPINIAWRTEMHGRIADIHPHDLDDFEIQHSIVFVLDESASIRNFDNLITQDWNWTYSWDHNNTHLILDHDEFPPGTQIDLDFNLVEIRSLYDDSSFIRNGQRSFSLTLNTKSLDHPTLISTNPENGNDGVRLDENIRLNFDKPINVSSLELTFSPDVDNLTYTWSSNNKSVLITHDGFSTYQNYSVFIEAECEEGLPLISSEEYETSNPFSFRTDYRSNPTVEQISPKDGTEHYLSNSPIVIQFDKKIRPESLEFSCEPNPGYWEDEWTNGGTILILDHGGFDPGREITFVLENVRDMRGNGLTQEVSINFKISDNGEYIEGNMFQRKLWSFIGGGPYGESLFDLTEEFLTETTSNMILSSEMSNLEYRVPLMTEDNFEYSPLETNSSKELEMLVDFRPGYLQIEDILEISDPSGHHFTEVTTISSRPFKTEWEIIIPDTKVFLDVKQEAPYMLGDEEPAFLSLNETYLLGFGLSISVASGWALEGVEYTRDDIDLSSVLDFLNRIWDLLKEPLSYLLDGLYKVLELFDNIVNRLKEHAASLVEYLGKMVENLVSTTLRSLAETILDNRDRLQDFAATLSLLGINMGIDVYEDGKDKRLPNTDTYRDVYLKLDVNGSALGTTIDLELYVLDNNVIANGSLSSDSMNILWQIDPFARASAPISVYDSWFQSQGQFGKEGDGAILHLEIPEIEKDEEPEKETEEYSTGDVFPALKAVSIPIGPVVVSNFDFGLKISYIDVRNISSDVIRGSINNAFWNTVEYMRDSNFNLDYIVEFVRTFADLLLEELIRFLQSILDSIELFFSCTVNQIDVIISFGLASAEGVLDFIKWIGQQVRHLLQSIVERRPNCNVDSLPSSILEETVLSVEVGLEDASTVGFSVNVPAIASIIGKDLGEWRIEFEVESGNEITLVKGQLVQW
ncbi:MAG: Ig-like domain-containing protein [Thermoplasmatota archaeon]